MIPECEMMAARIPRAVTEDTERVNVGESAGVRCPLQIALKPRGVRLLGAEQNRARGARARFGLRKFRAQVEIKKFVRRNDDLERVLGRIRQRRLIEMELRGAARFGKAGREQFADLANEKI